MKKMLIIRLIIFSIILSAILIFDSSNIPSTNNEGLRKPDMVVDGNPGLVVSFKLNKHTFYVQF